MTESGEWREFPQRLHHTVPVWAKSGFFFHIRLRVAHDNPRALSQPEVARVLLDSVRHYHEHQRWFCMLFLLMPDHAHALLAFPLESRMSRIIGEWKHYATRQPGVRWQVNYFDHRVRNAAGLAEKYAYILRNPVVKKLGARPTDWPWVWRPDEGKSA